MAGLIDIAKGAFKGAQEASKADTKKSKGQDYKERERVTSLISTLTKYQQGKSMADDRLIENDRWYRSQQWDIMREKAGKGKTSDPEPTTNLVFNTVANKHGDLMDAFPEPVFMEREPSDREDAEQLSKVIKYVLDRQKFRKVYSDCAWYKVKAGTSCYHVAWDQSLEGGLGDISIKKVDLLRLYWQPGIDNIQNSKYVFALSLMDKEDAERMWPDLKDKKIEARYGIDLKKYNELDAVDTDGMVVVIDCYYKERQQSGSTILHMDKIIGDMVVDSTKNHKKAAEDGSVVESTGLYDHGLYPFVFDCLFPEEHSLLGFGMVDIVKNPQMYIDKIDQILTRNAFVSGKQRVLVKKGLFPVDQFMDLTRDVIEVNGSLQDGQDFKILQANSLPVSIMNHRNTKISELKEVSGANDFSRGSATGGVTSATAILALQEAGNKLSRAMVAATYDAYVEICNMALELIIQFYDEPRKFRITNEQGDPEYVEFSNAQLKEKPIEIDGVQTAETRKPIYDIVCHPEKYSPFSAIANNEIAKELFGLGFFNPEMAPAALTALKLMSFDGKDRLEKSINEMYQQQMEMQQATNQAQQAVGQQEELLIMMNDYIKQLTGEDMLDGSTVGQPKQADMLPEGQVM